MEDKADLLEISDFDYFRSYLARVEEDDVDEDRVIYETKNNERPRSDGMLDSIREDLNKMMKSIQFSMDEERLLEPENTSEIRSNGRSSHLLQKLSSPFSVEARKSREEGRTLTDFSLVACRKVSVVIRVCSQDNHDTNKPWEDNENLCVYPNMSSSDEAGEDKEEEDECCAINESDEIILVNPKSFGKLLPTTVTVETAWMLSQISPKSSEDWVRHFHFDSVLWPSTKKQVVYFLNDLAAAAVTDAFSRHSSSLIIGYGSPNTEKQIESVFGSISHQSVSLAKGWDINVGECLGILGLTVATCLRHPSFSLADGSSLKLSVIEIVDEDVIRDLLADEVPAGKSVPKLRHPDNKGAVMENILELPIENLADLFECIKHAFHSRDFIRARKHDGGRGHIVASLTIQHGQSDDLRSNTTIQFYDLACSEGDKCDADTTLGTNKISNNHEMRRSQERRNSSIRKSLSCFTGILRSLSAQDDQIGSRTLPFRDCTLTKLMQRPLDDEKSRIVVLATINGNRDSYKQSLQTLVYASQLASNDRSRNNIENVFWKKDDEQSLTRLVKNGDLLQSLVSDPRQRVATVISDHKRDAVKLLPPTITSEPDEVSRLRKKVKILEDKLFSNESQVITIRLEKEEQEGRHATLMDEKAALQSQFDALVADVSVKDTQAQTLCATIDMLKRDISELSTDLQSTKQSRDIDIKSLEEYKQMLLDQAAEADQLRNLLGVREKELDGERLRADSSEQYRSSDIKRSLELEAVCKELRQQMTVIRLEKEEQEGRHATLMDEKAALQSQFDALVADLSVKDTQAQTLCATIDMLKRDIFELSTDLQSTKQSRDNDIKSLEEHKQMLLDQAAEADQLRNLLSVREKELDGERLRADSSEQSRSSDIKRSLELEAVCKELRQQMTVIRLEKEEQEGRHATLMDEKAALQSQFDALVADVFVKDTQAQTLCATIDMLKREIFELSTDLQSTKQSRDNDIKSLEEYKQMLLDQAAEADQLRNLLGVREKELDGERLRADSSEQSRSSDIKRSLELEAVCKELRQQMTVIRLEKEEQEGRHATLMDEKAALQSQFDALVADVSVKDTQAQTLCATIDMLKREIFELSTDLQSTKQSRDNDIKSLEEYKQMLLDQAAEADQLRNLLSVREKELDGERLRADSSEQSRSSDIKRSLELEAVCKELRQQMTVIRLEKEEQEGRHATLMDEKAALQSQFDALVADVSVKDTQAQTLCATIDMLKRDIFELSTDLQSTKQSRDIDIKSLEEYKQMLLDQAAEADQLRNLLSVREKELDGERLRADSSEQSRSSDIKRSLELEAVCKELRQQMTVIRLEKEEQEGRHATLMDEKAALQSQFDALVADVSVKDTQAQTLCATIDMLKRDIFELSTDLQSTKQSRDNDIKSLEEYKQMLLDQVAEADQLRNLLGVREKELDGERLRADSSEQSRSSDIKRSLELEAVCKELRQQMTVIRLEKEEQEGRHATLMDEKAALQSQFDALVADVSVKDTQAQTLCATIDMLKREIFELSTDLQSTKQSRDIDIKSLEEYKQMLLDQAAEADQLRNLLGVREKELDGERLRADSSEQYRSSDIKRSLELEAVCKELRQQMTVIRLEKEEQEGRHATLMDEKAALQSQFDALVADLTEMRLERGEQDGRSTSLGRERCDKIQQTSQVAFVSAEKAHVEPMIFVLKREWFRAQEKIKELEDEKENMQQDMRALVETLENVENQVLNTSTENSDLKKVINTLETNHSKELQELKLLRTQNESMKKSMKKNEESVRSEIQDLKVTMESIVEKKRRNLDLLQKKLEEERFSARDTIDNLKNTIRELECQIQNYQGAETKGISISMPDNRQLVTVTKEEVFTYRDYQEEKILRSRAETFAAAMAARAKSGLDMKNNEILYLKGEMTKYADRPSREEYSNVLRERDDLKREVLKLKALCGTLCSQIISDQEPN